MPASDTVSRSTSSCRYFLWLVTASLTLFQRMKALLFTLVRAFEFELAVPANDIEKRTLTVTRPYLKGGKAQMPLRMKLCKD